MKEKGILAKLLEKGIRILLLKELETISILRLLIFLHSFITNILIPFSNNLTRIPFS